MSGPIGKLRNTANTLAAASEILIHWDSDDWSGPYRIADQVQTLIDSGRDCVGYRTVLFWRQRYIAMGDPKPKESVRIDSNKFGEAWSYSNILQSYAIGASFCYWRRIWERARFRDDMPKPGQMGEDKEWLRHVDSLGVHSFEIGEDPYLVCAIHGGNTIAYDIEGAKVQGDTFWKRAPEWDERLAEIMKI